MMILPSASVLLQTALSPRVRFGLAPAGQYPTSRYTTSVMVVSGSCLH